MPTHAAPDAAGRLHHVELAASDLPAAVDFWGWLLDELGYERRSDWEDGRSWGLGPTYVVVKRAGSDRPHERAAPGLDHLAFHAGSRAQVDRVADGVRERPDATLLYPEEHPYAGGYYAAYCEGPEGVTAEVVGPDVGSE